MGTFCFVKNQAGAVRKALFEKQWNCVAILDNSQSHKTIDCYRTEQGCWITFGFCEAPLSCVGIGFSWNALTASGGNAESSDALAPDTTIEAVDLAGRSSPNSSLSSSLIFGGEPSCFSSLCLCCTILIPPTFCAGACPALSSLLSSMFGSRK